LHIQRGQVIFSATDLVTFLGCRHATYLDRRQLDQPLPLGTEDPLLALLQEKGLAHERRYLQELRSQRRQVVEISGRMPRAERHATTVEAMRAGAEVIYQGALSVGAWHGYADFLTRVPGRSRFGDFLYEALDTKLSHTAKPGHALQLAVYSMLLATEQGAAPRHMHLVLGDERRVSLRVADLHFYFEAARQRLSSFVEALPANSLGQPCGHCGQCRWSEHCEAQWLRQDHLSLVANVTRGQRSHLEAAGISTLAALSELPADARVPGLQAASLQRLRTQARLQAEKRRDGTDRFELLPVVPGRGFERLPPPSEGDLFFDMEGDPLVDGGLEYLFGFVHLADGAPVFVPFWGHSRAGEKRAFEQAVDFIMSRLAAHPAAFVYHYANYEESALKRLAMLHGTRENEVDHLLRSHKLVDLYQVVREAILVSEPSYSIKNLETFYTARRTQQVTSAGASVVVYERWRLLEDAALLREIADYNEADCRSTRLLRDWLLTLRPDAAAWFRAPDEAADPDGDAKRLAAEQRAAATMAGLGRAPQAEQPLRTLVGQLLEFHRRENKPAWWALFNRQELTEEQLIDDTECIGGLRPDPDNPPYTVKRSRVHSFRFPPQDFKIRVGDRPKRASTLGDAGEVIFIDEEAGLVSLKIGNAAEPYEPAFSLIPQGPRDAAVLRDAIYRYADALIDGSEEYRAISSILRREYPRLRGAVPGRPLLTAGADSPEGADLLEGAAAAIADLDDSHLLVQGPPGTGKTFLSAHSIVGLLAQGRRVGVASNSHKAINNLLLEIERQSLERGIRFRGAKKSSTEDQLLNGAMIEDVTDNDAIHDGHFELIAGTAWLFSRPEFDQSLDHLFIDEAGQVSLANVVAMGTSARNIVLVGDQMQLSQPIQGVHPGDSGQSALEFVLGAAATVPPEQGIFLPVTRRMHPDVCRFISEAVYDGRLHSDGAAESQRLVLGDAADPALRPSGISWVAVPHVGCSQKSETEAARIAELHAGLLRQQWTNTKGETRPLAAADILVVSPYNVQVNLLKSMLPAGARVGTVDRFQGQEAAVVLISMTTSSAEDVSRGLEFLYSRNRLNVAISRARCLAVVVASPRLLEASCSTIEQMRLVNTLCFVKAYAEGATRCP
jgi:uncharacterized protein